MLTVCFIYISNPFDRRPANPLTNNSRPANPLPAYEPTARNAPATIILFCPHHRNLITTNSSLFTPS